MPPDFEKEVHEESSLSVKERVDLFLENLSVKWQEFLDWSDEKGLPLRGISNFFEERGIPAVPAMLFILLLLLAGIYVAFVSVSTPVVKSYSITVRDADGLPLPGASVQLQFSTPAGLETKTLVSDAEGKAVFGNVPSGRATVAVHAVDYEPETRQVAAEEADTKVLLVTLVRTNNPNVVLSVVITGPLFADIVLYSSNNSVIEVRNATTSAQFELQPNSNYSILAKSPGYRDEAKFVVVANANANLVIRMFGEGEERSAPVYIRVFRSDGLTPVANATVKILDEATGAKLAEAQSGVDGSVPAIDIRVGRNVSLSASHPEFLSWFLPSLSVNEPEASVSARLIERTSENSKNIVISVIDEDGRPVQRPTVVLYCPDYVDEKEPENGVAGFDADIGVTCTAAVSREGFLPLQKELTSAVEQSFIMRRATSANSGTLVVETVDQNGNTLAGADVAVLINGSLTGINQRSGIDGLAKLEHLPLGEVSLTGSTTGMEGGGFATVQSIDETGIDGLRVSLALIPAKGVVFVEVVDHFGRTPIGGALVEVTDVNGLVSSCVAANGSCVLRVEQGEASARISANGFEELSVTFDVFAGSNSQVFELISVQVAGDTSLVFLGVFDADNKRVSILNPAARYTAKYLLKSPSLDFSAAKAFIQIGEKDIDLESGAGSIVSFSSPGGRAVGGVDYSSADFFEETSGSLTLVAEDFAPVSNVLSSGELEPLPETQGTSAVISSEKFKWVEFSFDRFEGSKELKVVFETAAVQQANVELFHRTQYDVRLADGTSEVFRNPVDKEAGTSASPLFAALAGPDTIPIEFEGRCVETMCVQLWFEGASGKASAFKRFEAVVPETFKLGYRILAPPAPLQGREGDIALSLQVEGDGIQVGENQSTVARQVRAGEEGFFSLRAVKFSNNVPLFFSAVGSSAFEEELHVSVSNANNELRVSPQPSQLVAFQENSLLLRISDKFGAVVENARVVLSGQALPSEVEAREEAAGLYAAEVFPSLGSLAYSVEAEGFKKKTGMLQVIARSIISIEPRSLSISIDSTEPSIGSEFVVTNLAPDKEVRVSITVLPSQQPRYSQVSADDPSFTLKGGETKTVSLVGNMRDVIPFGASPNTLRENYSGKVNVVAKLVGFTQSENLDFRASAFLQQQPLAQLVDYSADSLEFAIDLPRKRKDSQEIRVTNNAPKPLLINQHSDHPGVFVSPVSATIAPGESAEFNVTASPSGFALSEQCVLEDLSEKAGVEFIASFQGVRASKNIGIDIQTTSNMRCSIPGAVAVVLPMDVNFLFPAGTIAGQPAFDSSQAVKLPNQELLVFSQGSQVTHQRAYLSAGAAVELMPFHVAAAPGEFQVSFPVPVMIGIPPQAQESTLADGSTKLSTNVAEIILPPGLQRGAQGGTQFASSPFFGFPSAAQFQRFGSFFGTSSSFYLPPGRPIRIVSVSAITGEPFTISYDQEVFLEFPLDAQAQQSGSTVSALLSACTQLEVYTKTGQTEQIRDVLPSARQVSIQNARLTGRRASISEGGRITVQTCTNVDEDAKMFQTKLRAPVTFVLPPGAPNPATSSMRVSFPNCAELVYKSGYALGIGKARAIAFPQGAVVNKELENGAREIEVRQGETLVFAPCRSASPSVSTFAGPGIEARTKNGEPLSFVFTEADISKRKQATQTICLVNHRKGVVSPADGSFISTVLGAEAISAGLKLEPVKSQATLQLSPSKPGECNNEFKVTAEIPRSVHDNVCITRPSEDGYSGTIKFSGRDSSGWSDAASLAVRIIVQHGSACKREHEKAAAEFMRGLFVDYSIENTNQRTGNPFVFAFKGTGQNHGRVLTILNNHEAALALSTSGTTSLQCDFPPSLQPSQAVAVKCIPQRITQGKEQLVVKGVASNREFEQVVNVEVFQGNPDIYKNSSWGELAPFVSTKATQAPRSVVSLASDDASGQSGNVGQAAAQDFVTQCSTHYCTYEQAQKSFDDFVNQMAVIAREKLATSESQQVFCNAGANPGKYQKSSIMHLANTERDFAGHVNAPRSSPIAYTVASAPSVKGCGVYQVTAKLDLCTASALGRTTPEERMQNSKIEISDVKKIADCPRNLANAPLFLGSKRDDLTVFLGRELGFSWQKPQFLKATQNIGGGMISFGPYSTNINDADAATVKQLMQSVYGEEFPKPQGRKPEKFDHNSFCLKRGSEQIGIVAGAGTAIAGASAALGVGAPFAARLAYGAVQAGVACGLTAGGEALAAGISSEREVTDFCPTINGCVRSAVFGALTGIAAPAGGAAGTASSAFQAAKAGLPSKGGWVVYGLLVGGATVGAEALSEGESPVLPPGAAGPTTYAVSRTIGQQLPERGAAFEQHFQRIRGDGDLRRFFPDTQNGREAFRQLLREEGRNPGLGAFKSQRFERLAVLPPAEFGGISHIEQFALQRQLNEITGNARAIKASSISQNLRATIADEEIVEEVYKEALKTRGRDGQLVEAAKKVIDRRIAGKTADEIAALHRVPVRIEQAAQTGGASAARGEMLKQVETGAKDALKDVAKTSRFSRVAGFGRRAAPVVGQLAAQLVLDIDVRPTQITVPRDAKNVLVVYHIENPYTSAALPSIYQVCMQGAAGQCEDSFFLANACNSDTDACMIGFDLLNRRADAYSLLVVFNNQRIGQKELFDSLMFPEAAPLNLQGKFRFDSLTAEDLALLREDDSDNGDESALKSASSKQEVEEVIEEG